VSLANVAAGCRSRYQPARKTAKRDKVFCKMPSDPSHAERTRCWLVYGLAGRDSFRVVTSASGYSEDGRVQSGSIGLSKRIVSRNAAM